MIGSLLTRGLVMVFGYAYPTYECYKTVEMNKPNIGQLLFWCQYWILVAVLTVGERIVDAFVSWVPMYNEAKLAFFIYLWYPKTRHPQLAKKVDTASESTSQPAETEAEAMQIETVPPPPQNEGTNPPPKETLMRQSIRLTRGRLRKNRSAPR
ncbi:HVA22-like protein i [Hibiscus syriacus]|uniref:HVA22-like protein i n=1 Tax=Hibiscus syriacus TaxID=106335 RepID=UPI0019209AEC|nr:HVA22-like protein i [Hibiscus syriacus]